MQVIFPTTVAIANVVPDNGNTVPISGLQGITNSSELLAYGSLLYENANTSGTINFGGLTGTLPICTVTEAKSLVDGQKYMQIVAYIPLNNDHAAFPEGKKQWRQVQEIQPFQRASSSFNF
jgi:hypothetical protein